MSERLEALLAELIGEVQGLRRDGGYLPDDELLAAGDRTDSAKRGGYEPDPTDALTVAQQRRLNGLRKAATAAAEEEHARRVHEDSVRTARTVVTAALEKHRNKEALERAEASVSEAKKDPEGWRRHDGRAQEAAAKVAELEAALADESGQAAVTLHLLGMAGYGL